MRQKTKRESGKRNMNERIYKHGDGSWYFTIRGNQRSGPYETYDQAEASLERHVQKCRQRVAGTRFAWPRKWHPLRALRRSTTGQS